MPLELELDDSKARNRIDLALPRGWLPLKWPLEPFFGPLALPTVCSDRWR